MIVQAGASPLRQSYNKASSSKVRLPAPEGIDNFILMDSIAEKRTAIMTPEQEAIRWLTATVDEAIRNFDHEDERFRYGGGWLTYISTEPGKTRLTSDELRGKCTQISSDLTRILQEDYSLDAHLSYSATHETSHRYITVNRNGIELIVDPAIGQFIHGHEHVFVGTRAQLQQLVNNVVSGQSENFTIEKTLFTMKKFKPEEVFDAIWGQTSEYLN